MIYFFKNIRQFFNKETSVSRTSEFSIFIGIVLIIDILILVILYNLDYIFDKEKLKLTQYIVLAWLLISNLTLIKGHSNIYSYLYATHPYTFKLKKEKEKELALKKEETIRQQIKLNEETAKETARLKAIEFENRMRKRIKDKKRIEEEKIRKKLNILLYDKLQTDDGIKSLDRFVILKNKNFDFFNNEEIEEWLNLRKKELKDQEYALKNSPLTNYFNAVEGGETILYYLKLQNKFGETRYKIGITLNSVKKRYLGKSGYKILYEKKLTHANTIEKKILEKFNNLVTDESLLGTNGTEIFKEDVLNLDC